MVLQNIQLREMVCSFRKKTNDLFAYQNGSIQWYKNAVSIELINLVFTIRYCCIVKISIKQCDASQFISVIPSVVCRLLWNFCFLLWRVLFILNTPEGLLHDLYSLTF